MKNTKENLSWLWKNAERILIVAFFLTFSLNIRKVFLTPYSFLNGGFNEYMTMSFSWADLLMLATIVIYTTKTILRQVINPYYASPGPGRVFNNVSRETLYLIFFLAWVSLSIFWSRYRPIAIYRFLTLVEIVLFATIAIKYLQNSRWLRIAIFALVLNGFFQSLLSIAQFVHNASLGFHLLGESIIGPSVDGVAKILINGEKHIRAYGTFPHPNILAGFLLIPLFIIITDLVNRMFPSLIKKKPFAEEVEATERSTQVSHETILGFIPTNFLWLLFSIIGFSFILTFSRSAFLGLFVGLAICFIWIIFSWRSSKISKVNLRYLSLLMLTIALTIITLINNTSFFSNQSLQERKLYQIVSYETISKHSAIGVGIGQFILNEYSMHPKLKGWQYQPVHNTYLLIFGELGIIGFIFFLLSLTSIFLRAPRDEQSGGNYALTNIILYCIILSFLTIFLFDHYLWDIKLGMLIFTLPLIILSKKSRKEEH